MRTLPALLSTLLLTACVTNPERDCGLYDFDCDSTPTGPALITAQPETSVAESQRTTPANTDNNKDLTTRVELLEEETRRLRRRIEVLEGL